MAVVNDRHPHKDHLMHVWPDPQKSGHSELLESNRGVANCRKVDERILTTPISKNHRTVCLAMPWFQLLEPAGSLKGVVSNTLQRDIWTKAELGRLIKVASKSRQEEAPRKDGQFEFIVP
ncbi:unnamed protein product [Protopolystoma xenopodis]|uniref:Uncharacterized protein n=1 Tax=Protopolystoma xenopodis TaxID=117903 RepID=A0A448XQ99_9PLAT|nr:unnamed protein product [Protopolystoma xenopodis]